ncbi:MAG: PAS domain S-box protein [Armatimonadetes bacterium]|nr:PAS domain S-box protein [Anaerolineae bacterium]
MQHWLRVPHRTDAYEAFGAGVLHYALLVLLCATLLFSLFVSSPVQIIFIPLMLAILGGCYVLLHTGRLRAASTIFVGGFWIIITVASFSINGIRNASVSSYAIVIIFSAILFSNRAVIVITLMSVLAASILAVGETLGVLPLRMTPFYLADRFFQQIVLFSVAGILLAAASRMIRTNFTNIYQHDRTLLERNQALELEIAERRRVELNLRISETKYRLLFENIPVMAGVYGQDGEIILLNNAAAQMLGGTPHTLQGRNMRDVLAPDDAEYGIKHQARVMAANLPDTSEGKAVLPNGRELYFLRYIMPLPNAPNQGASQVLVLTTDLTEKHLTEQRQRELVLAREKKHLSDRFFQHYLA